MTDVYVTDVTAEVQDVVHKSARWLNANILKGTYKPNNVFFSGSFKGNSVSPDITESRQPRPSGK